MPAGDGTGPPGMGPMTGRGAGYCAGYGAPGYAGAFPGRGFGLGRGWGGGWGHGRGRRNWYYATGVPGWARFGYATAWGAPPPPAYGSYVASPIPEQEAEFLRRQAEWLKQELDSVSQRIMEFEQEE